MSISIAAPRKTALPVIAAAVFAAITLPLSCSKTAPADAGDAAGGSAAVIEYTDCTGRTVRLTHETKMAAAMGSLGAVWLLAGGELYGVTRDGFEYEGWHIPEHVRSLGSLLSPDVEQIIASQADCILLSPNLSGHLALRGILDSMHIQSICFDVTSFADYLKLLRLCTAVTGRADLFEQYGSSLEQAVQQELQFAKAQVQQRRHAPTVLVLRAYAGDVRVKDSTSLAGAMLKELGCVNIADSESGLLETLSMEAILTADPEFIFAVVMGRETEKSLETLKQTIIEHPAWASLSAVKQGRFIMLPSDLYHYKPNERWAQSYHMLNSYLYAARDDA
ncbi:MAG TPA: ABC transporter substrate-binding protein [Candidatus Treponema faecavium]|nr:ABC transporter substrate-binding protein [Candidatus Treponema faecavium]